MDVQPTTSIPGDDLFESEAGFKDALTGFYLKMGQTNLYAENLTYGYLEAISGNYDLYPNLNSWKDIYDYDNTWLSVKNNIYGAMYNVIANINNFLKYIDKNRSVVKTDKYYELMKGEALGLRAFLHFDLLRIFGPCCSAMPASHTKKRADCSRFSKSKTVFRKRRMQGSLCPAFFCPFYSFTLILQNLAFLFYARAVSCLA